MNKIRPIQTSQYALERALGVQPIGVIAEMLGISSGLVYKMSDPDTEKEISVKRALMVDRLCFEKNGIAPFSDIFSAQLNKDPIEGSVKENVLYAQASLGELAGQVVAALSAASDGGEEITSQELQAILTAVEILKKRVNRMERVVLGASGQKVA